MIENIFSFQSVYENAIFHVSRSGLILPLGLISKRSSTIVLGCEIVLCHNHKFTITTYFSSHLYLEICLVSLNSMNRSHLEAIYDSCFLDSSSAVVTTDKKLFLFENLETQIERILALDGVDSPYEYPEPPSKHQQLKHFRDCRYQPVHGKNNLIVHGCKNDIRLYDRRMPLKSFSTIKLSDKSIPTSIHLAEQYVTCSLIPWNQKRKNNQQSVLSLFDIRSHLSMDGSDKLTTGNINSKAIRYV